MIFKKFRDEFRQGGFQRQTYDVTAMNIKCKDCGTSITQLPFNPDPTRLDSIRCLECMKKFREANPRPRRF